MQEKSHRGRRHKGCGMCKYYKRIGNGAERRPPNERRHLPLFYFDHLRVYGRDQGPAT